MNWIQLFLSDWIGHDVPAANIYAASPRESCFYVYLPDDHPFITEHCESWAESVHDEPVVRLKPSSLQKFLDESFGVFHKSSIFKRVRQRMFESAPPKVLQINNDKTRRDVVQFILDSKVPANEYLFFTHYAEEYFLTTNEDLEIMIRLSL